MSSVVGVLRVVRSRPETRRQQTIAMNWIYQVLSFFVAFGPVILGTLLWHFLWNDDSDSSGGPPGGPRWHPLPPSPSISGDRLPRHDEPVHSPELPTRERA